MISIIHPSRGRPKKSFEAYSKWSDSAKYPDGVTWLCSLDWDDDIASYMDAYTQDGFHIMSPIISKNKSSVDAINNAAKNWRCDGDIIMVVSDDTEPIQDWDAFIDDYTKNDSDWILKTQDGIQPYIITMPVMDRAYYNRTGYIYHPDFQHLFCDTYMTCVADITGRKITSNLMFKHNHYSVNGTPPDDIHKKNDATWKQGEETFIRLMKQFSREELNRIQDQTMKNWLKMKRVL